MIRRIQTAYVSLLNASFWLSFGARARLMRWSGMQVGPGAAIGAGGLFNDPARVQIGPRTLVNHRCIFEGRVRLGRSVFVGPACVFTSSAHDIGSSSQRAGTWRPVPIVVEDGVWIGAASTILPGVTLGRGCVIAAGSVVTRDCEADALYAGTPARKKRELPVEP